MNNSKYRFTLDMHSTISQVSLPLRENDAGVELRITLTDGGTPYFIADGCRAVFCARKSDDKYLLNDCIIEKNTTIYYKLTQQTTAAKGVVDCEIRVYGIDNNLLTSPKFILVVSDRVWHDSDFPMSDTEKHAIDTIFANEKARQDAEASRVIAEEEREKTHQEMLDTVKEASDAADILTEKIATGDYNGLTPYIGANGNWWIGETDTGVLADGYSIPLRKGSEKNSVEQIGCEASEENSVALGKGTIASSKAQISAGEYNKENLDALFIVGNGTSDTARSNALEVLKDGTLLGDSVTQIATGSVVVSYSMPAELHFDFYPRLYIYYRNNQYITGYVKADSKTITISSSASNSETVPYVAIGNNVPFAGKTTTLIIKDASGNIIVRTTTDVVNPYISVVDYKEYISPYTYFTPRILLNGTVIKSGTRVAGEPGLGVYENRYSLSLANDGNGTSEGDIKTGDTKYLTVGQTNTYYLYDAREQG